MAKAFKAPSVWVPPLVLVAVLVFVMTLVYLGSVIDPAGHLHGLPVGIVNEDAGANVGTRHVDLGQMVAQGLGSSRAVTSRLALRTGDLAAIETRMDVAQEYAAVVIPAGFTASLLAIESRVLRPRAMKGPGPPLRCSPIRAGNARRQPGHRVLQPALAKVSAEIGQQLRAEIHGPPSGAQAALLSDPVIASQVPYRPLPRHTALGLSAFYIALLTTFCGFLGGTVVHVAIDSGLGYASTEIGPRWNQRPPVQISRWHTLLAKWAIAVPLMVVLTGLMLLAATWILHMHTPHFGQLWLLTWFAATVVSIGTLVLFAALGTLGQLLGLLIFVYLALASSGGTVPLQALPGVLKFLAEFEPLRQIVGGTRSILYFDARGAAGLTRAFILTAIGLGFWLALGAAVTNWYDRKGFHRVAPAKLDYIDDAVRGYRDQTAPALRAEQAADDA